MNPTKYMTETDRKLITEFRDRHHPEEIYNPAVDMLYADRTEYEIAKIMWWMSESSIRERVKHMVDAPEFFLNDPRSIY